MVISKIACVELFNKHVITHISFYLHNYQIIGRGKTDYKYDLTLPPLSNGMDLKGSVVDIYTSEFILY